MVTDSSHFLANRFAPAFARARVSAFLGSDVPQRFTSEASLLTSELVTNSVIHSSLTETDEITLDLDLDDIRLLVTVTDASGPFERLVPGTVGDWGLVLVDRLADRWGIVSGGRPNDVWFELDR